MVFQNHGHELKYGNLILQDKNIWELFLFKYIIPKYLRRIWINEIRFERVQVTFQRECGRGRR